MNKPLSISNTKLAIEKDKLNIRSVTEVINLFNIKSPRHKSRNLQQRSSSATKSMASPRNISLTHLKTSRLQQTTTKITSLHLCSNSKRDKKTTKNCINISSSQKNTQTQKLLTINIGGTVKKPLTSEYKRDQFRKKTVTRLMKQLGQFQEKKVKENIPQIPALKIKQVQKKNKPKILSDRLCQDYLEDIHKTRLNTTRSTKSIKIDSRQTKNQRQSFDAQLSLRKGSASTTLSFKQKYVTSAQCMEDDQELFSSQPSKRSSKPIGNVQTIDALEQVKSKIYSQINSLDKKLLTQKIRSQSSKHLKISLKKKNKVQVIGQEQKEK